MTDIVHSTATKRSTQTALPGHTTGHVLTDRTLYLGLRFVVMKVIFQYRKDGQFPVGKLKVVTAIETERNMRTDTGRSLCSALIA